MKRSRRKFPCQWNLSPYRLSRNSPLLFRLIFARYLHRLPSSRVWGSRTCPSSIISNVIQAHHKTKSTLSRTFRRPSPHYLEISMRLLPRSNPLAMVTPFALVRDPKASVPCFHRRHSSLRRKLSLYWTSSHLWKTTYYKTRQEFNLRQIPLLSFSSKNRHRCLGYLTSNKRSWVRNCFSVVLNSRLLRPNTC